MHSSLTTRSRTTTIAACGLVVLGSVLLPGAVPALPWAVAAVFGVVAGDLQARGMRAVPDAFRNAQTSVEVRTALMSTGVGRFAVLAQWLFVLVLVLMTWRGGNLIASALGGFALYMAARDLMTLRAVAEL